MKYDKKKTKSYIFYALIIFDGRVWNAYGRMKRCAARVHVCVFFSSLEFRKTNFFITRKRLQL